MIRHRIRKKDLLTDYRFGMRRGTGLRSPESHAREHAEISVKLPWVSEHARNCVAV
jgi:hypothetical protein